MKTRRCTVLLSAVLSAAAAAQDAPPPPLRLGFVAGQTQYYHLSLSQQTHLDQGDRKLEATLDVELLLSAKVAAVKDGKADLEFAVHHTVVKLGGARKADYDSDAGKEVPAAARRAVDTFGGPFHVSIDDRARTSGYELPHRDGTVVTVEHTALESILRQALPELPEQPLAAGGSWQTSIMALAGLLAGDKILVANKLVGVDGQKATIEQQLQLDPGSTKLQGGGSKQAETFRGASVIDLATGLPCSAEMEQVLKLESKAGGQATRVRTATRWALRATDAPAPKPAGDGREETTAR